MKNEPKQYFAKDEHGKVLDGIYQMKKKDTIFTIEFKKGILIKIDSIKHEDY